MTRDPHCDGCKADDAVRALRVLRRERDELRARLDALEQVGTQRGLERDDGAMVVLSLTHEDEPTHLRNVYRGPWRPVSPETTP